MKEYILSLCFAILFCTGVNILVPSKKYEGIIRILCGIFVIATVVTPLKNAVLGANIQRNTPKVFESDPDFEFRVSESQRIFTSLLSDESRFAELIELETERMTGEEAFVRISDGKVYVAGIREEKRPRAEEYIKSLGAEDVIFE